jgi:trehalose/maltose hydrolase-like predicted phosphorylase
MGGVWQALAFGFAGLRSQNGALRVHPQLPAAWEELEIRLRFRGTRARLRVGHEHIEIDADGTLPVAFPERQRVVVGASGARFARSGDTWKDASP